MLSFVALTELLRAPGFTCSATETFIEINKQTKENNKETWKENNGDHSDRAWATVSLGGRMWVSPNDPGQENLQTFFQEVLDSSGINYWC
jgi:hypothetical protein